MTTPPCPLLLLLWLDQPPTPPGRPSIAVADTRGAVYPKHQTPTDSRRTSPDSSQTTAGATTRLFLPRPHRCNTPTTHQHGSSKTRRRRRLSPPLVPEMPAVVSGDRRVLPLPCIHAPPDTATMQRRCQMLLHNTLQTPTSLGRTYTPPNDEDARRS